MNLLTETAGCLRWFGRLAGMFFALRPLTTSVVLVTSVLSRITGILAFVLPLKIVLLVASDGVSRWFQPFVGPEGKDTLIVVLTIAAVVSFFAAIAFDALTERLAASTSLTVLRGSNELAVVGDQGSEAQTVYSQFAAVVSGVLFTFAGFGVIALVNWPLVAVLVSVMLLEFVLTATFLWRADRVNAGPFARFVTSDLGDYLQILSSVNFLLAFGVILYPFIWGGGGTVIAALVSIIVLRRMLGVMVQTVQGAVKMVKRRPVIDALVFRHHQYQKMEKPVTRTLRDVFHKQARQESTWEALQSAGVSVRSLDVRWEDSRLKGVSLLAVHAKVEDKAIRRYQQQIYMPKNDHRLENEAVLFTHLSRANLNAPEVVLRFSEGPFECQLCKAGSGEPVPSAEWNRVEQSLMEHLMSVRPPAELVRAFVSSRPLISDRVTASLVERAGVAVDTDAEWEVFESLRRLLPHVQRALRELPLFIYNPEVQRPNVLMEQDGTPLVMTWGRWSLEPVGAGLNAEADETRLTQLVSTIRQHRSDIPAEFGVKHLRLACAACELETQISRNCLKAALESAERLVGNPLFVDGADDASERTLQRVGTEA